MIKSIKATKIVMITCNVNLTCCICYCNNKLF